MADAANLDAKRKTPILLGVIGLLIAVMFVLSGMHNAKQDTMVIKVRLLRVRVMFESIELALDKAYDRTHTVPKVTTVLTHANERQPAAADWARLGYSKIPALPAGVDTVKVTEGGDIVVSLSRIDKDIDGTTVRANANRDVAGSNWKYSCTSRHEMIIQVFGC